MSESTTSTRRSFLKRGALLAAPVAAAAVPAVLADEAHGLKARLARLEDAAAIRELHQNWLRSVNSGGRETVKPLFAGSEGATSEQAVFTIAADPAGQPDAIAVASDGKSASGRFHCLVEIESTIPQDCTLAQMAHAQGSGFIRRTERGELRVEYEKALGSWTVASVKLDAA